MRTVVARLVIEPVFSSRSGNVRYYYAVPVTGMGKRRRGDEGDAGTIPIFSDISIARACRPASFASRIVRILIKSRLRQQPEQWAIPRWRDSARAEGHNFNGAKLLPCHPFRFRGGRRGALSRSTHLHPKASSTCAPARRLSAEIYARTRAINFLERRRRWRAGVDSISTARGKIKRRDDG